MRFEYINRLNEYVIKKSKLLHEISTASDSSTVANEIIDKLEQVYDDPEAIENSKFKMFFKNCVIVNKEYIYFIIGIISFKSHSHLLNQLALSIKESILTKKLNSKQNMELS